MMATTSPRFVTNRMCPFAQKVWIALEVTGVDYEFKEISLYGSNGKPDWFWDLNPEGTVPVLESAKGVYADSEDILDKIPEIIEDGGAKLLPGSSNIDKDVTAWRKEINQMLPIGKNAVLGGSKKSLMKKLEELDALAKGPYLCGDDVTLADCAAFPFLWRLNTEFDLRTCPNIQKWLKYCESNNIAFRTTIQSSWWWWW